MTIAIAVQVDDGVVLASDSALTLTNGIKTPPDIINVYNNSNKIFNLKKGLPIGGMTYGIGNIGPSSIATLAKDLRRRLSGKDPDYRAWRINPDDFTVLQVAEKAREFLYEEHFIARGVPAAPGTQLGFFVAGYSSSAQLSEVWLIEIINGQCAPPRLVIGQGVSSVTAGGDPEVFSRLVLGHSQKLAAGLQKAGVPPPSVASAVAALEVEMHIPLVEAPMPIQDAIDFGEFLVRATITFTRFKRGAATVGGPIESAAITKHEGFKWVRRKHYYDESLNPRSEP